MPEPSNSSADFGASFHAPVSAARRAILNDAADRLADARRTQTSFADLPPELQPTNLTEAYIIQDQIALAFGDIGGWKIGAASPDATPLFAPMPLIGIAAGGSAVRAVRYRGVEAEVAFLIGTDLPPRRSEPYTRDEVLAAIASCHPAIEVLDSGFTDPMQVPRLCNIADLQMHSAFLYGNPYESWQSIDWSRETVSLAVDGSVRLERTGSNTAGDLLRLLPWLANEGAARTGGLRHGQWVTTGSWTGNTLVERRSAVDAQFSTLGRVSARIEPEQELEKGVPGDPVRSFP